MKYANPHSNDAQGYHPFVAENGDRYGSFEVFYRGPANGHGGGRGGWYWRSCFPGCLPDSEPVGPFKSSAEAMRDARAL